MPRVLFCAPADPLDERAAWLWDLAESLRTRGYEVVVAHSRGRFHDPMVVRQRYPHPITEQFDGSAGLREQRLLSLLALFQRVRPDIIVTVGLADALYAAAEWKRRGSQARVVGAIHEVEDEALVADLALCQPFLDLVVATSRRMADRLKAALSMGAGRVLHIPAPAAEPGKAARDRNKVENVGLFGQLEQKGRRVLDLVSLAQRLENEALRFHIGGRGPEEGDLRARLKEEVGRGAFFFYGDLSKQERYENFYPRLDALLVLSERESGPMVLWEAMAHGIVPVVSDYVGRKEEGVIHQGKTGLVFPVGDMKAAAEKIRELKRGGKVESLSKNARQGLPAAYRQADFSRRWNEELQRLLRTELRTDPVAMLPRQVSPGWIARLGFSPEGTLRLRKLLRRRRIASNAAVEWPSSYGDKN